MHRFQETWSRDTQELCRFGFEPTESRLQYFGTYLQLFAGAMAAERDLSTGTADASDCGHAMHSCSPQPSRFASAHCESSGVQAQKQEVFSEGNR